MIFFNFFNLNELHYFFCCSFLFFLLILTVFYLTRVSFWYIIVLGDNMKKAIIEGMCCSGCANDIKYILSNIYGISNVSVSYENGYALFDGFVSKEIIAEALKDEGYRLVEIEKL